MGFVCHLISGLEEIKNSIEEMESAMETEYKEHVPTIISHDKVLYVLKEWVDTWIQQHQEKEIRIRSKIKVLIGNHFQVGTVLQFLSESDTFCEGWSLEARQEDKAMQRSHLHAMEFKFCGEYLNNFERTIKKFMSYEVVFIPGLQEGVVDVETFCHQLIGCCDFLFGWLEDAKTVSSLHPESDPLEEDFLPDVEYYIDPNGENPMANVDDFGRDNTARLDDDSSVDRL